jgi:sigma-B regulation protein RsbU (phosphoserine phosphatase)
MLEQKTVRILLIEDNRDFAKLVEVFLKKHEPERFEVTWEENGSLGLAAIERDPGFDVILMDYFLPGKNGLEITRLLHEKHIPTPIIFLTVNKDFDLAVEVMKLGVEDYLVKEEVTTPVLPKTILNVLERQALKQQLTMLEISQRRLEAISEMVLRITQEIRLPLDAMQINISELVNQKGTEGFATYLNIIRDNLQRIEKKITQLKALKSDKTVPYIKDIRMFDLSE